MDSYIEQKRRAIDVRMEKVRPANRYRWCDAVGGCACMGCVRTVRNVHDWLDWVDRNPTDDPERINHIDRIRRQANCSHESTGPHHRIDGLTVCHVCRKWLTYKP